MRANIVLDTQLMDKALKMSGLNTKQEVVEEALKLYVQMLSQKALHDLKGKLTWEGDLNDLRMNP
ncbi:MAG: type II toxin-antitoxin system VapB family antitoxin [Bacteroidetes bacterium]|nr:MAG: type II toxin-antitoxin system VapB family antitoxin [Bacteroidota bacterium]